MKLNLPNKLTVLRLILVPIFVVVMMASDALWATCVGLFLFIFASLTDMWDGKIARKHNLITDFGKFMDPLADKFMVIGAQFIILYRAMTAEVPSKIFTPLFFWALLIVVFRELAVTSIRLVVSGSSGIVVAANMLGKIKTCTQIACVICCLAEPVIYAYIPALNSWGEILPVSIATTALMLIFTVWSGLNYILSYWKYLDPEK
ncbi:MAG: CDP-diacylglycerol--glycerol-3-phosphate 3-phosphatidyltransferase [Clostridia bacterium]|nr:CDP-diacylglycerol--glycerol-3-phosphate 3-phosphatidyltransferase [Clostridia bacterium]MBR2926619.1 CDP-diacylglycerol--glycerol-3-phosphate 3-phosphatidyltransferase [Clostridia bacterium]